MLASSRLRQRLALLGGAWFGAAAGYYGLMLLAGECSQPCCPGRIVLPPSLASLSMFALGMRPETLPPLAECACPPVMPAPRQMA